MCKVRKGKVLNMSNLFTIMIMWVLVYNGWCPQGLALGYTIAVGAGIVVKAVCDSITATIKERQKDRENLEKMFKTLDNFK